MCGACGDDRYDWGAAALGGAYTRTVVARLLTAVGTAGGRAVSVTPGAAGWMLGLGGRPARLHRRFDDVIDALAASGLVPDDAGRLVLESQAGHRILELDRRAVPPDRRAGSAGGSGDDRSRLIHRIVLAALQARTTGCGRFVEAVDQDGPWMLVIGRVDSRLSAV